MLIIDEINHSEGEFTKAQRAFLHKLFLINSSKVVAERAGASFPPCAYLTMQYRNKIGPTLLNSWFPLSPCMAHADDYHLGGR